MSAIDLVALPADSHAFHFITLTEVMVIDAYQNSGFTYHFPRSPAQNYLKLVLNCKFVCQLK
jgi:hypothetical protein